MGITKAVIPAAGFGTRFLPATKAVPKPLVTVVDTPTIQYIVAEAVEAGLTDILIVTSANTRAIADHFDRSWELEAFLRERGKDDLADQMRAIAEMADIHYVDQHEPRGLGHAVSLAERHVGDEPFAVLLSDNIMDRPLLQPMIKAFDEYGRSVVALQEVARDQVPNYGIAEVEGVGGRLVKVLDIVEKPPVEEAPSNLAAIGRYVFMPGIFEALARTEPGWGGEIQLTDAIRSLAPAQAVFGYLYEGKLYDVGRKPDYLQATVELAAKDPVLGEEFKRFVADFAARHKLV
ncbi:MAG TPA: UTP--glucose-1-phosphate uridylyltransferase GalU [Actinomycetota bacterium]